MACQYGAGRQTGAPFFVKKQLPCSGRCQGHSRHNSITRVERCRLAPYSQRVGYGRAIRAGVQTFEISGYELRQGTDADTLKIWSLVLSEKMNPLGLDPRRFTIATPTGPAAASAADGANRAIAGVVQVVPLGDAEGVSSSSSSSDGGSTRSPSGPRLVELRSLVVAPEHRRRGLGSLLVQHRLQSLPPGTTVWLTTVERREGMYKRLGFRRRQFTETPRELWFTVASGLAAARVLTNQQLIVMSKVIEQPAAAAVPPAAVTRTGPVPAPAAEDALAAPAAAPAAAAALTAVAAVAEEEVISDAGVATGAGVDAAVEAAVEVLAQAAAEEVAAVVVDEAVVEAAVEAVNQLLADTAEGPGALKAAAASDLGAGDVAVAGAMAGGEAAGRTPGADGQAAAGTTVNSVDWWR